jgi:hypothetical protein
MAKHKDELHKLSDILNYIDMHTDECWIDVMGIDIEGYNEAESDWVESNGENEDAREKMLKLREDFAKAHANDIYLVSWPEHVTTPRFNSDAWYRLQEPAQ